MIMLDRRGAGLSDRRRPGVAPLETQWTTSRRDRCGGLRASRALERRGRGQAHHAVRSHLSGAAHPDSSCSTLRAHAHPTPDNPWSPSESEWRASPRAHGTAGGRDSSTDELPQGPRRSPTTARPAAVRLAHLRRASAPDGVRHSNGWWETEVHDILPTVQVADAPPALNGDIDRTVVPEYFAAGIPHAALHRTPTAGIFRWVEEEPARRRRRSRGVRHRLPTERAETDRVLATVLFTDIVGSTASRRARRQHGETCSAHHAIVRAELVGFRGNEINTDRRRLPRDFRRPGSGGSLRCAIADAVASARDRDPGRRPHRRDRLTT